MVIDPNKKLTPTRFDQPEEKNWKKIALMATLIVLAILGIVWMVTKSPKQHSFNCSASSGNGSWSSFGRCRED